MVVYQKTEKIRTYSRNEIHDITDTVNEVIKESGIENGMVVVQTLHTTTGIAVNENEKNALEDILNYLEKKVPYNDGYKHDNLELRKGCPEDEPINCDSHIKSCLYSQCALTLTVTDNKVVMGEWQRLFFEEFDGPRPRKHKSEGKYIVNVIGE